MDHIIGGIKKPGKKGGIAIGVIIFIVLIIVVAIVLWQGYERCWFTKIKWMPASCDTTTTQAPVDKKTAYPWECRDGLAVQRNYAGDIACGSNDGKTCADKCTDDAVAKYNNGAPPISLVKCGCDFKAANGITGYDTDGHWCKKYADYFNSKSDAENIAATRSCAASSTEPAPANGSTDTTNTNNTTGTPDIVTPVEKVMAFPWKCEGGYAYRRNQNGDVECASTDGKNCMDVKCDDNLIAQYNSATPPANLKPLACGCDHNTLHGVTGYENDTHWCKKHADYYNSQANAIKSEPKKCMAFPWKCINGYAYRRNKDGNVECGSNNNRDCVPYGAACKSTIDSWNSTNPPATMMPLACGCDHNALYGITGYDYDGHWCKTKAKEYNDMPQATQFVPIPKDKC
jgi:hypothetical protein